MIHHPGAEYGNNVGCVLLITTKKNLQGLAIVENSGFLFDSFVSNNHDLDLTYTHGKMTYYGKLGYANWQGIWKEQDIATNYVSGSQAGDNATTYIPPPPSTASTATTTASTGVPEPTSP